MLADTTAFVTHCDGLQSARFITLSSADGVTVWQADFAFAPGRSGPIKLTVDFPMVGILSTFSPTIGPDRGIHQWFAAIRTRSDFYFGSPFISAVRDGKYNYLTLAASDAVNSTQLALSVEDFEQQEKIRFTITLLNGMEHPDTYSVQLRLDERPLSMVDTVADLHTWFESFYPVRCAAPAASEYPLYSSWYNFHQHPDQAKLTAEMEAAAEAGFTSMILDDGWSYDGPGVGDYSCCGDWAVSTEKFPDMAGFVRATHDLGIKVSWWFPVPFVGVKTADYQRFKDKCLYIYANAGVLDVRYAQVRDFIVNMLAGFVQKYDLDGLKLDFIDAFVIKPESPAANPEMDIPALGQAVIALLEQLDARLKAIRPDLLLEYRQNYVGPAITRYGNMLRVGDCAFSSDINRIGIADLRLLNHPLAVHADMLFWSVDETVENIARQMLCTLFGVPQISVLLTEVPAQHRRAIKAFVSYWQANRATLLHGKFDFEGLDCGYPLLSASDESKTVTALYKTGLCSYAGGRQDVHNATAGTQVVVVSTAAAPAQAVILDLYGEKVAGTVIAPGANLLAVPVGGRVEIG